MKFFLQIFFRYLFGRLFAPFAICVCACAMIWIMADLYGNLDDFLEHKINILLILRFYSLQLPNMLVQVLPAALLFSTLWTLMTLNRRSELVAFQSGGMAPIWLYSPFFVFAVIWMIVLAIDMNFPAPEALVTRERLLQQVKGQAARYNVFTNLPYIDRANRLVWFFQVLDANQGTGKGVEILQQDGQGHDMEKYFARRAKWTGDSWQLNDVLEITYNQGGGVQAQKMYDQKNLDVATPPNQISLVISEPEQLTVSRLSQYIDSNQGTTAHLAKFRTEWWYRMLYPLSLVVLMFFGLLQGTRTDRRTAAAGVFWIVVVLIAYVAVTNVFLTAGRFDRLPPFVAAIATEVIFGAIGLGLLVWQNGWWWQLWEIWRRWTVRSQEG
jgi:lipopolysaccharide export system permease protein